jgi:predicted Zn-dependent protease
LKERGFKKKGRTFRRYSPGAVQVVNIQGSRTNSGDSGRFTMNLGVYFPSVARLAGTETESPLEYECTLRARIGRLMPTSYDHWWELDAAADIDALAADVADAYRRFGEDWLQAHSDVKRAAHSDESWAGPITRAALLLEADQRDAAVDLMTSSLAQSKTAKSGWYSFARAAGLEPEFRASLKE